MVIDDWITWINHPISGCLCACPNGRLIYTWEQISTLQCSPNTSGSRLIYPRTRLICYSMCVEVSEQQQARWLSKSRDIRARHVGDTFAQLWIRKQYDRLQDDRACISISSTPLIAHVFCNCVDALTLVTILSNTHMTTMDAFGWPRMSLMVLNYMFLYLRGLTGYELYINIAISMWP